ncbi:MAG: HPr family phosphocarrier protein [Micrococcales bacterium]|nr:HPr family phosphocarrier protein [Actinomycetota bacterium]NCA07229.1 HPr family phosphocarrier protein [Micrococcales bacterium]
MVKGSATVGSVVGLHARPAADFVRAATLSQHEVFVVNKVGKRASGLSILGILGLGAKKGDDLVIEVTGPDEEVVLKSLIDVVSNPVSQ